MPVSLALEVHRKVVRPAFLVDLAIHPKHLFASPPSHVLHQGLLSAVLLCRSHIGGLDLVQSRVDEVMAQGVRLHGQTSRFHCWAEVMIVER